MFSTRTALAVLLPAATVALVATTVTGPAGATPTLLTTPPPGGTLSPSPSWSPPYTGLPGLVTDLRVAAITPTSITLAWSPSTPGNAPITGYRISWKQEFDDIARSATVGNGTTATITEGISPTGEYPIDVAAVDANGRSGSSALIRVVTPRGTTGDVTPPSRVDDLRVPGITADRISLSWAASTDDVGVTGYDVYWFDGVFVSTLVATTPTTSVTTALRPNPDGIGAFYVRARDAAGNLSIASPTFKPARTSTPPTGPTTSPAPPRRTCDLVFRTTRSWAGGFTADVTVTNTAATAVQNWTATFTFGGRQRVVTGWNARVSQSGATVTLTPQRWNERIPAGGSVTVGLIGTRAGSDQPPSVSTLNGVPCTTTSEG